MAHFIFVTWPGGGNVPPALGIAYELRVRGHTITLAGYASQEGRFRARGFRFVLLEGSQAISMEARAGYSERLLLDAVLVCSAQLAEIPRLLSAAPGAVLVLDCMLFVALAAAERIAVPAAVLVHSAPEALMPLDGMLERMARAPLNALRAEVGLAPLARARDAWLPFLVLCATHPLLEPPAHREAGAFDYLGPAFDGEPPSGWRAPWPPDDPRPLVVVSFSTVVDHQRSRIERTLTSLANRPYRVLVTAGREDVADIRAPENATIVSYVPHAEVLPGASVIVTHAGHGTVTAALAYGVPLVCLPNANIPDQIPLAQRVEALGAGRVLDGDTATPAEIAAAVDAVLTTPGYAEAARRMAATIAALPGTPGAASRLERLAAGG